MGHEYVENSRAFRHCGGVYMYIAEGCIHVKCRCCNKWVNIGKVENFKKDKKDDR